MINCKDCKHWNAPSHYPDADPELHKLCGRIGLMDHWEADNEPAFVQDGSGYIGNLWTKPDFGCAAGEQKEPES